MDDAYRGRAGAHVLKGNKAEALADLDKAVMLDPENVACRLARSNLLLGEDDRQGAKADLDAALQVSREHEEHDVRPGMCFGLNFGCLMLSAAQPQPT